MTSNGVRVLQIGADRSKRGIHVPGTPAYARQQAYAAAFGELDIIGYSLAKDGFSAVHDGALHIYPTNAPTKLLYGTYALMMARRLSKPAVVSAQDAADTGLLALWIARMLHVPLHIQVHTDIFARAYGAHSIANRVRQMIARFVLKRADGIRVVSEGIKQSIEAQLTPKRAITVLPIFVDIAKFQNPAPDAGLAARFEKFGTKLLFVGRLEPEKHPCLAIESFAKAAPQDACLIIVGTGSERAHLERKVHELHVAGRVFFEGERDAAPYYAIADVVLVTSRYEGYGLVIIEALAAGKPVLATDVGVAREAGAIVAEGDYAEALQRWFETGPRSAGLHSYSYRDFDDYVAQYCRDIASLV